MGRESAKFTTRDGFDVVIRSKVDELAEMMEGGSNVTTPRSKVIRIVLARITTRAALITITKRV